VKYLYIIIYLAETDPEDDMPIYMIVIIAFACLTCVGIIIGVSIYCCHWEQVLNERTSIAEAIEARELPGLTTVLLTVMRMKYEDGDIDLTNDYFD
jgi:hypothetical protein